MRKLFVPEMIPLVTWIPYILHLFHDADITPTQMIYVLVVVSVIPAACGFWYGWGLRAQLINTEIND